MVVFSPIDRRNQQRWRCSTWAAEAPRRACWAIPAFRRRRAASQRRSWTMTNWIGWVTANRYICFRFETKGRGNGLTQGLFSGRNSRENDLKCSCCQMYRRCIVLSLFKRGKSLFLLDVILSFTNTPNVLCFFRQQKSKHKGPLPLPRKSNTAYGQSEEVGFSHQIPRQACGVRSVKLQPYSWFVFCGIHLTCGIFFFSFSQDAFADDDEAQTGKDVAYDYEQDELGICKPVFLSPSRSLPLLQFGVV